MDRLDRSTEIRLRLAKEELTKAAVEMVNDMEDHIQRKYDLSFGLVRIVLGAALTEVGIGSMIESREISGEQAVQIRKEAVHYVRTRVKEILESK